MAVSSLYQLLVTQGDQVGHSAGLFTVNVSGRGGIPVGLFGPANEMAFSLRFRFVDASLGMTQISRASDHFSSAPDGLFWWPRRCAAVAILSGLTATTGRKLGWGICLGLIHRLLEAATTNSSTAALRPHAGRRIQ